MFTGGEEIIPNMYAKSSRRFEEGSPFKTLWSSTVRTLPQGLYHLIISYTFLYG